MHKEIDKYIYIRVNLSVIDIDIVYFLYYNLPFFFFSRFFFFFFYIRHIFRVFSHFSLYSFFLLHIPFVSFLLSLLPPSLPPSLALPNDRILATVFDISRFCSSKNHFFFLLYFFNCKNHVFYQPIFISLSSFPLFPSRALSYQNVCGCMCVCVCVCVGMCGCVGGKGM